jgi:large subunit ribosomal protein L25
MSLNFFTSVTTQEREVDVNLSPLRKLSKIPGIVYLKNTEKGLAIKIDSVVFDKLIGDPSVFTRVFEVNVHLSNSQHQTLFCILKDIQFDSRNDKAIHFDLMQVERGDKVKVSVPIRIVNKELCPGIKAGGDVYILTYNVKLKCSVEDIPTSIDIDVSSSQIGAKFKLSQIQLPNGVKMLNDALLAKVSGRRVISEVATQETAQPESGKETEKATK